MLTPKFLSDIEFNDVVELYNKLNIDITADIITRVSQMQDIIPSTIHELNILKQTNGTEIFNQALEETSMLTAQTKKLLKQLFEDMSKEDIEGYKELYEYRDKPFKLSDTQYKILNQGLKETNKTLKNFTNTIAFQSKQAYMEAVDSAYMKVASGAFDYATAIHAACQELAEKGITLKDKLGRKLQLEVAVRRNVMTGIQQTANNINRDIEEYLGCDGYEVTAHLGARPTHAEAQGKQYAISHRTKISKDYPLWSEVESLWSEYNCRHTYFGIILGISEPKYTDKELKNFKEATVTLNGKKVPYYEATQKQRQLENAIRKQKRTVQTLEKANLDNKIEKSQLAQLRRKYKDFCKETGLEKDYQRLQVAKDVVTNDNKGSIIKEQTKKKIKIAKTFSTQTKYNDISEEEYFKLQEIHRKNITENIRNSIYVTNWDNMQILNKYGYINSNYSRHINYIKRTGDIEVFTTKQIKELNKTISNLETAIKNNKIDKNIQATRYLDIEWFKDKLDKQTYHEIKEMKKFEKLKELKGKVVLDNQFISGSLQEEFNVYSNRKVKMIIQADKGTNAFITENKMEREIIFNNSKLLIKEISINDSNIIEIIVKILKGG